jgi:hypothetical protein
MSEALIETWREIILGDNKSWVLFKNGTCVILVEPEPDLAQQAVALLREWGPVQAGTSSADFSIIELGEHPGWVVTCHHDDILTYISPDEFSTDEPAELVVGLLGRQLRDQDASELGVVHVEDKRQNI